MFERFALAATQAGFGDYQAVMFADVENVAAFLYLIEEHVFWKNVWKD